MLCEEYKDFLFPHQDHIGHVKLLAMGIETGDHPPIMQKQYTLLLKHSLT